ncbi:right-handed parallel beta-helix repeat-containing protein [Arenibacter sp. F26102]|uniref:right-handed parallel beta-helix repeat-containing protein n=1 Tax=Arenibacter sp. F26102 TaxID=2926416 RepID=UPI001FF18AAD|nr:right-handed parallel beta-helix repeat-containing protein [Arenibacter sp. F26102]MCK0147211.1 right-handed parallel beta-helix repeat-containing protein [Arenibacter sp. F26102]
MRIPFFLLLFFLVFNSFHSYAQIIYVDPQLKTDCKGNYSILNRDCSGSDGDVYKTLQSAANAATAGTEVLIRGGVYKEQLSLKNSGEEDNYITFKNFGNEVVEFTGESMAPAIWIDQKEYIIINGLKFLDCPQFMSIKSSSHITVENCYFENSTLFESIQLKTMGDYFVFRNNTVKNGTDLLSVQGGSFHLVEGNTFHTASHTCLVFMGVHNSAIRNNILINPIQKLLEIFATRDREWSAPYRKSEHILIENNLFGPNSHRDGLYKGKVPPASWGTQFAGVRCIMRNNIFAGCDGGMDFCGYGNIGGEGDSPEAVFNFSNRIYNNTVYSNGERGRYGSGPGVVMSHNPYSEQYDNIFMNNIFYANRIFKDAHTQRDVPSVQIAYSSSANPSETRFYNNNVTPQSDKNEVVVWMKKDDMGYTLDAFEQAYPDYSGDNIQGNPQFVQDQPNLKNIDRSDYELSKDSPCVDAGRFLTYAVGTAHDSALKVEDPYFFSDGFDVVEGDMIRVGDQEVQVISIDYDTRYLILNKQIKWEDKAPVSLIYKGNAPDIGAVESY